MGKFEVDVYAQVSTLGLAFCKPGAAQATFDKLVMVHFEGVLICV